MVADQKAHRREAMLIVARLVNATVEAIGDRADLRTWITDADLQKVVTLIADQAATTQKVVLQEAVKSHVKVAALQLAAPKAAETLDLRYTVGVHRFHIADLAQSGLRGCSMATVVGHRLAAPHRLVEGLSEWDHRGCSMASISVAGQRSVMADRIVTAGLAIVMDVATVMDVVTVTGVRSADLNTKVATGVPMVARKLDVHRDLRTMVVGMAGLRTADRVITNLVANAAIVQNQLVEKVVQKATVDQHVQQAKTVPSVAKLR